MPRARRSISALLRSRRVFWLTSTALAVAYLALGADFVHFGHINHDEGWYLYASRLVYDGSLPYRDFAFFQAPVLPYLYGLVDPSSNAAPTANRLPSSETEVPKPSLVSNNWSTFLPPV